MNTNLKDTVVILGDSPFLNKVEEFIPFILQRNYSIGINDIILKFKTNEHAFLDLELTKLSDEFPEIKALSLSSYKNSIKKENKELYNTFPFSFERDSVLQTFKDGRMAYCGFTHDFVISCCIFRKFERIALLGTADFEEEGHYVQDRVFRYSQLVRNNSIKFINELRKVGVNIVTCNPNSSLDIPVVSIQSLL